VLRGRATAFTLKAPENHKAFKNFHHKGAEGAQRKNVKAFLSYFVRLFRLCG
jgi:hypothetical protein